MKFGERAARVLIAGALFGLVIGGIRGDLWPTIAVEGALAAAVIGGVWLASDLIRRFANRSNKPV